MDWLAGNWLWLLLAVGAVVLVARGGGCGMSHGGHRHHDRSEGRDADTPRRETTITKAGPQERTRTPVDHTHV